MQREKKKMKIKIKIRKKIYNNVKLHPFSNSTNGTTVSKDLLFKRTHTMWHTYHRLPSDCMKPPENVYASRHGKRRRKKTRGDLYFFLNRYVVYTLKHNYIIKVLYAYH